MPFVTRLFLQKENQVGTRDGFECSGTIIDDYWIATSFDCCKGIVAFKIIHNFSRSNSKKSQNSGNFQIYCVENRKIFPYSLYDIDFKAIFQQK